MMTANTACLRVARSLGEVENDIDILLGKTGALLTEIIRARAVTGHSAQDAQRPLARVAGLQSKLIAARSQILHAHGDLRKLGETMSIPFECPNSAREGVVPVVGETVQAIAA